jgi:hypothetical protein
MPFFAGFDTEFFPGLPTMTWLKANSNLTWCGYYLAPAPTRTPCGWTGEYNSLTAAGWGVVPIYLGQQDPSMNLASSILTAAQAAIDASNAASLANQDGFPPATFIYLDWEQGGLSAAGAVYISAWVAAMLAGNYRPGIYCSHRYAPTIVNAIAAADPAGVTRIWCWNVPQVPTFDGNLSQVPAIDPTGCGYPGATTWQREDEVAFNFPAGSGLTGIRVDLDTSAFSNPAY